MEGSIKKHLKNPSYFEIIIESQVVVKKRTEECCVHFPQPPPKIAFYTTIVQHQAQKAGMANLLGSLKFCHSCVHLLVIVYSVYGVCAAPCNSITCVASCNHHCNQDT